MSVAEFVLGLLSAVLGCSTLISWIFYSKANKQIKNAEAQKAQAEADKAKIETENATRDMYEETLRNMREEHAERTKELRASIADVNLMYHAAIKESARKEEIIEDKTSKIRELNEVVFNQQKTINNKDIIIAENNRYIDWLELWHCEREQPRADMTAEEVCQCCTRRKPPHKMPMKYKPYQTVKDKK